MIELRRLILCALLSAIAVGCSPAARTDFDVGDLVVVEYEGKSVGRVAKKGADGWLEVEYRTPRGKGSLSVPQKQLVHAKPGQKFGSLLGSDDEELPDDLAAGRLVVVDFFGPRVGRVVEEAGGRYSVQFVAKGGSESKLSFTADKLRLATEDEPYGLDLRSGEVLRGGVVSSERRAEQAALLAYSEQARIEQAKLELARVEREKLQALARKAQAAAALSSTAPRVAAAPTASPTGTAAAQPSGPQPSATRAPTVIVSSTPTRSTTSTTTTRSTPSTQTVAVHSPFGGPFVPYYQGASQGVVYTSSTYSVNSNRPAMADGRPELSAGVLVVVPQQGERVGAILGPTTDRTSYHICFVMPGGQESIGVFATNSIRLAKPPTERYGYDLTSRMTHGTGTPKATTRAIFMVEPGPKPDWMQNSPYPAGTLVIVNVHGRRVGRVLGPIAPDRFAVRVIRPDGVQETSSLMTSQLEKAAAGQAFGLDLTTNQIVEPRAATPR